jgi:hypothetical protein
MQDAAILSRQTMRPLRPEPPSTPRSGWTHRRHGTPLLHKVRRKEPSQPEAPVSCEPECRVSCRQSTLRQPESPERFQLRSVRTTGTVSRQARGVQCGRHGSIWPAQSWTADRLQRRARQQGDTDVRTPCAHCSEGRTRLAPPTGRSGDAATLCHTSISDRDQANPIGRCCQHASFIERSSCACGRSVERNWPRNRRSLCA